MSGPSTHAGDFAALVAAAQAALAPDLFAVIDGGLYDDLAGLLARAGVRADPLFLEAGDVDAVASGPFLAALDTPEQVDALTGLIGSGRVPVIWSWTGGQGALYRHLRTLNLASVPVSATRVQDQTEPVTVIFRHWDPIVLSVTLPVLTLPQRLRLMGAAGGLAFMEDSTPQVLLPPDGGGEGAHGFLSFDGPQIEQIKSGRAAQSRRAVDRFLNETTPELWSDLPSAQRAGVLDHALATGRSKGLRSERALGLWAWLMLNTGGAAAGSAEIVAAFEQSPHAPDITMDFLFLAMQEAAEQDVAAGS